MKKYLRFIFIIIYPYVFVLALLSLLFEQIMDFLFQGNVSLIFLMLIILNVAAVLNLIIMFIVSLATKRDAKEMVKINMVIKLIHIPAYIFTYLLGLALMLTIFTAGLNVILIVFDIFVILLSGMVGLIGIIRALREHKISVENAILYGLLQFVYCIDVVSAIVLYCRSKKRERW